MLAPSEYEIYFATNYGLKRETLEETSTGWIKYTTELVALESNLQLKVAIMSTLNLDNVPKLSPTSISHLQPTLKQHRPKQALKLNLDPVHNLAQVPTSHLQTSRGTIQRPTIPKE